MQDRKKCQAQFEEQKTLLEKNFEEQILKLKNDYTEKIDLVADDLIIEELVGP